MKKLIEERGSVSVYVFIVLFSFVVILTTLYASASSVRKSQLLTVLRIKQSYESDNENIEEIYQRRLNLTKAGTVMATKPSNWTSNEVTPISDGNGGVIPLPSGFYYVGGDIKEGIVISDKQADENKGTSYEVASTLVGNQFVWIPVSNEADLERTNFDSNGNPTSNAPSTGHSVTDCSEPYTSGYSDGVGTQEIAEYNLMRTQVLQYGGFYIGRYEAGDGTNGTALRTKATTAHTVVSKARVAPYNYVPWGTSMSDASQIEGKSGAVYLAKKMYEDSDSVTSTLIYGCQWDAMCRYLGIENAKTTPKKNKEELTASVLTDCYKNIYDLSGNCVEWTMEQIGEEKRVTHGGNFYNDNKTVSFRYSYIPSELYSSVSFRCAIYIK